MLYRVRNEYNNGKKTDEIVYSDKPLTLYPKKDKIVSSITHIFKYEVESFLPPTLHVSLIDGTKYITPVWIEVHPQTQLSDIKWTKWVSKEEKQRIKEEKQETVGNWTFESKSEPGTFYNVTLKGGKLKCNCAGMWRVRDKEKGCKHVQYIRKSLATQE